MDREQTGQKQYSVYYQKSASKEASAALNGH